MNRHLTATEISAWLAGERTPEHEQHVAECRECTAAVDRMDRTLARFGGALRDWGAREFETVRPVAAPSPKTLGNATLWLRVATVTAALSLAAGVPLWRQHRAAEIAQQDEALLQQVQSDISRSVPLPMEKLANLEKTN